MRKRVNVLIVFAFLFSGFAAMAAEKSWDELNKEIIEMYQKKYYTKAIPVAQKALDVAESTYGSDSSQTVLALNNLAMLYKKTGKYSAAEKLYLRELAISEKLVGLDHPDLCVPLNNLAMLYDIQKHYKKADEYSARAIKILEAAYGPTHAQVQEAKQKYNQMKSQR